MIGKTALGKGVVIALTTAAAGNVTAEQFTDVTEDNLPDGLAGYCMDAASFDAEADGDPDLLLAMEFNPNILLINDGEGGFEEAADRLPSTRHDSEDIAISDFDGDGDEDIVIVSEDDRVNEFYLNGARGYFTAAGGRIPVEGVSNAVAVLDLDDDGHDDILIGNAGGNHALINDGKGFFRNETEARWRNDGSVTTQDLELADVDLDGDLDVIAANEGQNALYLNDGQGVLIDSTRGNMPGIIDESREIKAFDADGDGDPDLAVANVSFIMEASPINRLLINDGSGKFSLARRSALGSDEGSHFTVQAVDLDGDERKDLLFASTVLNGSSVGDYLPLLSAGNEQFRSPSASDLLPASSIAGNGFDIEVADFNGDGTSDLFLCNRSNNRQAQTEGGLSRLLLRK